MTDAERIKDLEARVAYLDQKYTESTLRLGRMDNLTRPYQEAFMYIDQKKVRTEKGWRLPFIDCDEGTSLLVAAQDAFRAMMEAYAASKSVNGKESGG